MVTCICIMFFHSHLSLYCWNLRSIFYVFFDKGNEKTVIILCLVHEFVKGFIKGMDNDWEIHK